MKLEELTQKLGKPDTIPTGWRTSEQWAGYWGVHPQKGYRLIRDALKNKLCTEKSFRVVCARGIIRPIQHYRFKGEV